MQDEATRIYLTLAQKTTEEVLLNDLAELKARASESLIADGIDKADLEVTFQADLRYAGQAFEISVDFTEQDLNSKSLNLLTCHFDDEHEKLFTFKLDDGHEILMIREVVKVASGEIAERHPGEDKFKLADCKIQDTRFFYDGQWHEGALYDRSKFHQKFVVPGPAIVIEMDSTTVVLPGYQANIDAVGNLLINPVK